MRRIKGLLCILCFAFLTAAGPALPDGEFFDDFDYESPGDPLLAVRGWRVAEGILSPPPRTRYAAANVRFAEDPSYPGNMVMYLKAVTENSHASMVLARVESEMRFHEGTYAARVFFDNALRRTRDANIQTFYTINELRFPGDTLYSECDMEYLSWDIWNTAGNTRSKLYLNTWETYREVPWMPDMASDTLHRHQSGWHTLLFRAVNGHSVQYYLDKGKEALAEHRYSPAGSTVYPESPMRMAFANWIILRPGSSPGDSPQRRESVMGVDWCYFAADTALSAGEVLRRVRELQKASTDFLDTLPR